MKNHITTIIIALGLALIAPAYGSEVTGTLCTGLNCPIESTVIAAPVASPAAGTYTSARSVTLTAAGSSSIRYTVDGSTPDCTITGTTYSGAISVSSTKTIKAISCYPNSATSSVASFAYTISSGGGGGGGGGGGYTPPSKPPVTDPAEDNTEYDIDDGIP